MSYSALAVMVPNGTALQRTGSRCICVMATTVRAITGLTLAAAAIGAVTLLPLLALNAVFLLLLLLAALEWARFCVISPGLKVAAYGLTVVLVAVATRLLDIQGGIGVPFFVFAAVGWLGVGAAIVCHQRQGGRRKQNLAVVGIFGVVVLASAFSALSYLGELGAKYLLVLFGIVWGADVFAYFGGRRFGKRLLASNISPGKTWEGVWSGFAGVLIIVFLMAPLLPIRSLPYVLALACLTFVAAVIGDLSESVLKRNVGLKDSGALLPGHGGILDRVDSMLAAAPVIASIVWVSEQST